MSCVTNIIIFDYGLSKTEIEKIKFNDGTFFKKIDFKECGGGKNFEVDVYAGAFDYFDKKSFCKKLIELKKEMDSFDYETLQIYEKLEHYEKGTLKTIEEYIADFLERENAEKM